MQSLGLFVQLDISAKMCFMRPPYSNQVNGFAKCNEIPSMGSCGIAFTNNGSDVR